MDLTSKKAVKELLNQYQIRPLKRLGQNFLINKKALNDFIDTCDLRKSDVVLEIGPGLGTITQEIAKKVKTVIAIEKDKKMCEIMKETLSDLNNIEIINQDVLKIFNSQFSISNYKVLGNLPFYITAPVIRKFLETKNQPKEMIFMIQKEVGQRICAKPPKMSLLAVSVQFYAKPKIVSYLPKNSFWPQPKVNSTIIKIIPQKQTIVNAKLFFEVVKAGFAHPRKQLRNNLSKRLKMNKEKTEQWLLKNSIQPNQRAETLKVQDWINLTKTIKMN